MSQQFIDVDDDDWTSDLGSQDILDELKEGITKLPSDIDDNEYDSESESESQLVPMVKPEIKKEKTFLVMSMCHGNKIITRNINTLDPDFVNYLNELKTESWYEFVRKTYICGTAPFGNVTIPKLRVLDMIHHKILKLLVPVFQLKTLIEKVLLPV
jgi:hypothetical protein